MRSLSLKYLIFKEIKINVFYYKKWIETMRYKRKSQAQMTCTIIHSFLYSLFCMILCQRKLTCTRSTNAQTKKPTIFISKQLWMTEDI